MTTNTTSKPWENDPNFETQFNEYEKKREIVYRGYTYNTIIGFWESDRYIAFENDTLPEKKKYSDEFDFYMTVPDGIKWVVIEKWFESLKKSLKDYPYQNMAGAFNTLSLPTTAILKTKHQQLRDTLSSIPDYEKDSAKDTYVKQNTVSADLLLLRKYTEIYDKIMGPGKDGLREYEPPTEEQRKQINKEFFYTYVYNKTNVYKQSGGKSKKTRRARRKVKKTRRLRHHIS